MLRPRGGATESYPRVTEWVSDHTELPGPGHFPCQVEATGAPSSSRFTNSNSAGTGKAEGVIRNWVWSRHPLVHSHQSQPEREELFPLCWWWHRVTSAVRDMVASIQSHSGHGPQVWMTAMETGFSGCSCHHIEMHTVDSHMLILSPHNLAGLI